MSYSRWIDSDWYTFWCIQDEATENRDTAIFEICAVASFTAKELREDLDNCLNKVHTLEPKSDIDELKIYIKRFLEDVDDEYPE